MDVVLQSRTPEQFAMKRAVGGSDSQWVVSIALDILPNSSEGARLKRLVAAER
jgi:hypothetical protein